MNQRRKSPGGNGAKSKNKNFACSVQPLYPNTLVDTSYTRNVVRLYSPHDGFINAMFRAGLVSDVRITPDGQIHRFRAAGDKRLNSWYVFFGNGGAFGNWRTGLHETWFRGDLNQHDHHMARVQIKAAQKAARKELAHQYKHVSLRAFKRWQAAIPATDHDYLRKKNVKPPGTRIDGTALLVPMRIGKKLWSIQSIYAGGKKYFMEDAKAKGTYFSIGKLGARLWIAEGFSTGATIHEVTGDAVACAMYGDNMKNVAAWLLKHHPNAELLIAADAGKVGIRYGEAAMKAGFATRMVYPDFKPDDEVTDWNDHCRLYGAQHTLKGLLQGLER